ncbi:MAG: 1,4-dihydroxy-2-naphthoate octaprenyltransferase, partial [Bacteroidota bacterium]
LLAFTTVLLQILSNLANDYGDFKNGADNENRIGPARAVQSGAISPRQMKVAIWIFGALSFFVGLFLLVYLGYHKGWGLAGLFLIFGVTSIYAAITYTGGDHPYGYRGLGDLSVLLFFGLLGVLGSAFFVALNFNWTWILPAVAIGLLSVSVLNLNNLRDVENDAKTGKKTLVVRMGYQGGKYYHTLLMLVAWTLMITALFLSYHHWSNFLILGILPLHLWHLKTVHAQQTPKLLDPELKKIAISTFILSLILLITPL